MMRSQSKEDRKKANEIEEAILDKFDEHVTVADYEVAHEHSYDGKKKRRALEVRYTEVTFEGSGFPNLKILVWLAEYFETKLEWVEIEGTSEHWAYSEMTQGDDHFVIVRLWDANYKAMRGL